MKLALSATLLAQCVPALPQRTLHLQDLGSSVDHHELVKPIHQVQEATPRSTHLFNKLKRATRHTKQRVLSRGQGILKNGSPPQSFLKKGRFQCHPSSQSTDADTGILSCDNGLFCKESNASNLGGFCRAISASQGTVDRHRQASAIESEIILTTYPSVLVDNDSRLPCDPNAPDLGILNCAPGEFCRQDGNSDMGGICVPGAVPLLGATPASRRKLSYYYTVDDALTVCDPSSSDYLSFCDCTGVDTTTGSGSITCLRPDYTLCEGVFADISYIYSFANRLLTSATTCYAMTVPSYKKACFGLNFVTVNGATVSDSCSIEFNGQECSTCAENDSFYYFDCSAIDPNLVGSNLNDLLTGITLCYGLGYSACSLCIEGTTIPAANFGVNVTIPGYGPISCAAVAYAAANGFIPDVYCSIYAGIAQASCCAPASTDPTSTAAAPPSSTNVPAGGEPAPAPDGGEPTPAPDGGGPAPARDDGSSAALLPVHGVVFSVIVSTLAQSFFAP